MPDDPLIVGTMDIGARARQWVDDRRAAEDRVQRVIHEIVGDLRRKGLTPSPQAVASAMEGKDPAAFRALARLPGERSSVAFYIPR